MLERPLPPAPTIEDIDLNSEKLIEEGRREVAALYEKLRRERPHLIADEGFDEHKAWQGWAVQKISSLQLYVVYYEKLIHALAKDVVELQQILFEDDSINGDEDDDEPGEHESDVG